MNWLLNRKLSTQILLVIGLVNFLSILVVMVVSGYSAMTEILKSTYEKQEQMGWRNANYISAEMNKPVQAMTLAGSIVSRVLGDGQIGAIDGIIVDATSKLTGVKSVHVYWDDLAQSIGLENSSLILNNGLATPGTLDERFAGTVQKVAATAREERRDVLSEPVVYNTEKKESPTFNPDKPEGEGNARHYDRKWLTAFVAIPIMDANKSDMYGVFVVEVDLDSYTQLMMEVDLPPQSFASLISYQGVIVAQNLETSIGSPLTQITEQLGTITDNIQANEFGSSEATVTISGTDVLLVSYTVPFQVGSATERWGMVTTIPDIIVRIGAVTILKVASLAGLGMLVIAVVLAIATGRSLAKPVVRLTDIMNSITGGDLSVTVPKMAEGNEIGQMGQSVSVFLENAQNLKAMESEQKESAFRAEQEKKAMIDTMANNLETNMNASIQGLVSSAQTFMAAGQTMDDSLGKVTSYTQDVSMGSGETSTSIQTVAAACQELSSSINEISGQVNDSARRAGDASTSARQSSELVGRLEKAADQIGNVVALINEIAEQTNLLALNATIEAARAGDAGKGFAVVAGEVKNLASQTARATEEISDQIRHIQTEAASTVSAINQIAVQVDEISNVSTSIAAAVEEQSAATDEISRNVTFASEGAQNINSKMISVSEANMDANDAASKVRVSTDKVVAQTEELRNSLYAFLDDLRKDQ